MGLVSVRTSVLSFGSRAISDFCERPIVYAMSTAGLSHRSDLVPEALRSMTDPTLPRDWWMTFDVPVYHFLSNSISSRIPT
jgi:hypothetical protein